MTKNDIDFMSPLDVAKHMKPHKGSKFLVLATCGLVVLFFVWAILSRVEVVVRGQGQVVPSLEAQVVQSLEGGILAEKFVNEGDRVEKGQVLLRVSDVAFASEERGTEAQFRSLRIRKARLEAEANDTDFTLDESLKQEAPQRAATEEELYKSRQTELENALSILQNKLEKTEADLQEIDTQISRHTKNLSLLRQELIITSRMVAQKAMPKIEEIRLRREVNDTQGALTAAQERKTGLEASLRAQQKELEDQKTKFRSQALGELTDIETQIAALQESLTAIGDRVDRTELRAPVDGIINNIASKTIGGVIEPAQARVEIIPIDDDLKISTRINPNDIGFLEAGQETTVRILAYDSTRFGSLDGTVTRVGANTVEDAQGNMYFEIEVMTDQNHLGSADRPLPISPGMLAEVDVITDHRSILSYLAMPILRARDRAFRER